MVQRPWDPESRYGGAVLREYQHWVLEVSFRQHTLGCFIIFAKRNIELMSQLERAEVGELLRVMRDVEEGLRVAFCPNRFNYLQLGNLVHWLHLHGIPRYNSPRFFHGCEWTDPAWGGLPVWSREDVSIELVEKLVEFIQPCLSAYFLPDASVTARGSPTEFIRCMPSDFWYPVTWESHRDRGELISRFLTNRARIPGEALAQYRGQVVAFNILGTRVVASWDARDPEDWTHKIRAVGGDPETVVLEVFSR